MIETLALLFATEGLWIFFSKSLLYWYYEGINLKIEKEKVWNFGKYEKSLLHMTEKVWKSGRTF